LLDLPSRTSQAMEMALAGVAAEDREQLRTVGWSVRDSEEVSAEVRAYQAYITGSRGEFSAAKHAYVATRSVRFSDRTECYLAGGRPAVVQDTGLNAHLPTGEGLLVYRTAEAAVEGLEAMLTAYERHSRAARELAVIHFPRRWCCHRS
jgi:hypothetical protein